MSQYVALNDAPYNNFIHFFKLSDNSAEALIIIFQKGDAWQCK